MYISKDVLIDFQFRLTIFEKITQAYQFAVIASNRYKS